MLWFDLMHDVQVLGAPRGALSDGVLASIAAYYRRVTTGARPMNRLVALAMALTVAAIAVQISGGHGEPRWLGWTALALAVPPMLLAGLHTVPAAVRLGARVDAVEEQSRLARAICRDHLACLVAIATLLVVELAAGR